MSVSELAWDERIPVAGRKEPQHANTGAHSYSEVPSFIGCETIPLWKVCTVKHPTDDDICTYRRKMSPLRTRLHTSSGRCVPAFGSQFTELAPARLYRIPLFPLVWGIYAFNTKGAFFRMKEL